MSVQVSYPFMYEGHPDYQPGQVASTDPRTSLVSGVFHATDSSPILRYGEAVRVISVSTEGVMIVGASPGRRPVLELAANINASVNTLSIRGKSGRAGLRGYSPSPGALIMVGSEVVRITNVSAEAIDSISYTCLRAQHGTTGASHATGDDVLVLSSDAPSDLIGVAVRDVSQRAVNSRIDDPDAYQNYRNVSIGRAGLFAVRVASSVTIEAGDPVSLCVESGTSYGGSSYATADVGLWSNEAASSVLMPISSAVWISPSATYTGGSGVPQPNMAVMQLNLP